MTACTVVNWPAAFVLVAAIWAIALLGLVAAFAHGTER